jgi:MFS family permease
VSAQTLRALGNRNYRIFFAGQLVSMTGSWMRQTVQAWLVYRVSHSGWWLGAIVFAQQAPAFLLSPVAGIAADHLERRKTLVWVQAIAMLETLILTGLVMTGHISVQWIALLAVLLGVATGFEVTTRHAFAVDLVGHEDLDSAIALNSITINASRVVGPALGGLLIPWIGEAGCFALNGLSYLPIILGLLMIEVPAHLHQAPGKVEPWKDILEGRAYLKTERRIVKLLLAATALTFFGYPFNVLLPIFAKDVLHGGPNTLAWMTGLTGVGAVIVALSRAAHVQEGSGARRTISGRFLVTGVSFAVLAFSTNLWLSLLAVFISGYAMMGGFLIINNSIQHQVRDSMRGRVMSLYTMTFLGTAPVASLLAGWATDLIGVRVVTCVSGGLLAVTGFYGFATLRQGLFRGGLAKAGIAS